MPLKTQTPEQRRALEALAQATGLFLGPIAPVLIARLSAQLDTAAQLRAAIAEQIDSSADRARFMKMTETTGEAPAPAAHAASPAPAAAKPAPRSSAIDPNDLGSLQELNLMLIPEWGSDTPRIVKQHARDSRTYVQLYMKLAKLVSDPKIKQKLERLALDDYKRRL